MSRTFDAFVPGLLGTRKSCFLKLDLMFLTVLSKKNENENQIGLSDIDRVECVSDSITITTAKLPHSNKEAPSFTFYFKSPLERQVFQNALHAFRNGKPIESADEKWDIEPIKVFTGTWNLGNAAPPPRLESWLPRSGYHVYAVGVQECGYSPREPYGNCEEDWFGILGAYLGDKYQLIASKSLLEIRLAVFIHKQYFVKVSNIEIGTEATGIARVIGNKGAVAIKFDISSTSFCFVNCHLAAHQERADNRNTDFKEIVDQLKIGNRNLDLLSQFHYVFWMGDLNYRINLERSEVVELAAKAEKGDLNAIRTLLANDQFLDQREQLNSFVGFNEAQITFPPTYRMNRGQPGYSVEKNRIPSYTDRILWKALPGLKVIPTSYTNCPSITTSDHRPVSATFVVATHVPMGTLTTPLPCFIKFSDLRASDLPVMDLNGLADPFIVFSSPAIDDSLANRTAVVTKTRNPTWPDEHAPILVPLITTPSGLSKQFVTASFYDWDSFSANDFIGHCVIPLADAVGLGLPHQFHCTILGQGVPVGTFMGTLQVVYPMEGADLPDFVKMVEKERKKKGKRLTVLK
ncbi:hypothetical protein RCL1_005590 [Eukaryota sp. TZLM3-RCL]